jgi:outer membrane protein OmpA-like peptidoglycan-associated protein
MKTIKPKLMLGVFALSACAHQQTKEIQAARAAYEAAEQSDASEHASAELREARFTIARAERFEQEHPGSDQARDQAYIAMRKAEWARVRGETQRMTHDVAMQTQQETIALAEANKRMREAQNLAGAEQQKTAEALAKLSQLEKVTNTARGQVITLSRGVLFQSGKSELLPGASERLDRVADALNAIPDRKLMIEGHTDSQGKEEFNKDLSERRAQTVREYLVSRGISPDRVQITGMGENRPVADNRSPEGRAMNRRVEIVLLKGDTSTATK